MFFKYKDQLAKIDESQYSPIKSVSCILVQSPETHTHLPITVNKSELSEVHNIKVLTSEDFIKSLNDDGAYLEDLHEGNLEGHLTDLIKTFDN